MLHIIFLEPEIPGNSGAAIRLAACTGAFLHLVEPLGFDMSDTKLKRAGLDYHDLAHVKVHHTFDEALAEVPGRIWAFTGHASRHYSDITYADGDGLPLACLIGRCLTLESTSACASRCAKASALSTLQIPLPLPYTRPGASLASPTEFSVSPLLFLTNVSSIPDAQLARRAQRSCADSITTSR